MVMSPEKCRAEHWDTMCLTVFTVSSGGRPCLPTTHIHILWTTDFDHTACVWDGLTKRINTNSALHWCLSATWPLTSACWILWVAAMSCWPYLPASLNPRSPRGTGLAHLRTERQDSVRGCSVWNAAGAFWLWQPLTQKLVDIILL